MIGIWRLPMASRRCRTEATLSVSDRESSTMTASGMIRSSSGMALDS